MVSARGRLVRDRKAGRVRTNHSLVWENETLQQRPVLLAAVRNEVFMGKVVRCEPLVDPDAELERIAISYALCPSRRTYHSLADHDLGQETIPYLERAKSLSVDPRRIGHQARLHGPRSTESLVRPVRRRGSEVRIPLCFVEDRLDTIAKPAGGLAANEVPLKAANYRAKRLDDMLSVRRSPLPSTLRKEVTSQCESSGCGGWETHWVVRHGAVRARAGGSSRRGEGTTSSSGARSGKREEARANELVKGGERPRTRSLFGSSENDSTATATVRSEKKPSQRRAYDAVEEADAL
ncbi:hypothetical protein BJY59DRAFT_591118 [Rhodotorula toruloides]